MVRKLYLLFFSSFFIFSIESSYQEHKLAVKDYFNVLRAQGNLNPVAAAGMVNHLNNIADSLGQPRTDYNALMQDFYSEKAQSDLSPVDDKKKVPISVPTDDDAAAAAAQDEYPRSQVEKGKILSNKVIAAYYPNWFRYEVDGKRKKFTPKDFNQYLQFNHLNFIFYAFAKPYPLSSNQEHISREERAKSATEFFNSYDPKKDKEYVDQMVFDPWADIQADEEWNGPKKPFYGSFKELIDLKAQNPHVRTCISFGGWTLSSEFTFLAENEERIKIVAKLMVEFALKYGFDGIDIDWEYPCAERNYGRPEDSQNFVKFLEELRRQTNKSNLLLTIAVSANPENVNKIDFKRVADNVDLILVMAYDYNGPWGQNYTGHLAPLFHNPNTPGNANPPSVNQTFNVQYGINLYLLKGIPAHKLVLGAPLYGRSFKGCQDQHNNGGLFSQGTFEAGYGTLEKGTVLYSDIADNLSGKKDWKLNRDKVSGDCPYLYNQTTQEFITFEDPISLREKANFARENNLGGIFFWHAENNRSNNLAIQVAAEELMDRH